MKKIIILIPVFNDWESLKKLINEINESIKDFENIDFECLIVNDASTDNKPEFKKPNRIKMLEILNQTVKLQNLGLIFQMEIILKGNPLEEIIIMRQN